VNARETRSQTTPHTRTFRKTQRAAYAFLSPSMSAILIFFVGPVVAALGLSFTDFDIYALGNPEYLRFVGLENYLRLVENPRFWKALGNTLYFVVVGGPLSLAVSLGAALLINSRLLRLRGLFRSVFFLPVVTTLVAVAVVWRYLYHPSDGLLNIALGWIGIAPIDWLGDPDWAMPAIILMAVWKNFGYNMIILVAGLQSIPETLYEAARIDGAGRWQQFVHVTLPMLAPTFLFVAIITMIGYFQLFAEPYVMTQGGPSDATLSIVLFMYEEGFRWWNIGYAAAISFILFLVILVVTILQLRFSNRSRT